MAPASKKVAEYNYNRETAVDNHRKLTKATLVGDHLREIAQEFDITPTAAREIAIRMTGRGIDKRTLADLFGTPGRTAADKSRFFTDSVYQKAVLESSKVKIFDKEYRLLEGEIDSFNKERQASDRIEKNVTENG